MTVLLGGGFSAVPKVEFEENNFLLSNLGWPVNICHSTKENKNSYQGLDSGKTVGSWSNKF
jgi:hypothetical protein